MDKVMVINANPASGFRQIVIEALPHGVFLVSLNRDTIRIQVGLDGRLVCSDTEIGLSAWVPEVSLAIVSLTPLQQVLK